MSAAPIASLLVDVRPVDHPTARDRGIGRYTAGLLSGLSRIGAPVIGLYGTSAEAERALEAAPNLTLRPWGPAAISEHGGPGAWYLATQLMLHPVSLDPIPSAVTAARLPVAAVMYDVIPYRHPEQYLRDPHALALASVRAPLARTVDALLAISRFSADTAAEELHYPRRRVRVIGAGVDERFAPASVRPLPWPERLTRADFVHDVVAVTGADDRKNTEGLLRAWGLVAADVRRAARLVVATGAPADVLAQWRAVAADIGVADDVVFTGWVSDDEMIALLQHARLAILPSIDEGFGLPALEAAACGCPAICSGTSSLPEVLDEPAAWFDPHDPSSIADALERGLVDGEHRSRLVTAAARAVERFTWKRTATDTMAALAELGPRWPVHPRQPARRLAFAGSFAGSQLEGPVDAVVVALRRSSGSPRVDVLVDRSGVPDPTAAGPDRHPIRALGRYLKPWDLDDIIAVVGGPDGATVALAPPTACHVWLQCTPDDAADLVGAVVPGSRSVFVASDEMAALVREVRPDGPPILVLPAMADGVELAAVLLVWLTDVDQLPAGTIRRAPRPHPGHRSARTVTGRDPHPPAHMTDTASPAAPPAPLVRVVVINYDGGQMTLDCLDSLLATDWPADRLDLVLVDNGSIDDVAERVSTDDRYGSVRLLEPFANLGFAGGCNLGMMLPGGYDFVALINNDATVDPGWLRALVAGAAESDDIGAVNAKLLFETRFHGVDLAVSPVTQLSANDGRPLGVRITGVRLDGERIDDQLVFDEHVYGAEPPVVELGEEIARWTTGRGSVRVVADGTQPSTMTLRLSCPEPRRVTIRSCRECTVDIDGTPTWIDVALPTEPLDVINNVGSNLFTGGYGGDRGFLEVDRGQYDEPADVFAWCGGAVLLRRSYLDDVGMFDDRFFLYYEDTDLSWQGRLRGWRYTYAPGAVVRHRHGASAGAGSKVFNHYTERNRLLMLAKNAPARMAWRAGLGELRRLVRSFLANFVRRPLTGRLPDRAEFGHRWGVASGYAAALPGVLRQRWSSVRVMRRDEIMAWEVDKWAVVDEEPVE